MRIIRLSTYKAKEKSSITWIFIGYKIIHSGDYKTRNRIYRNVTKQKYKKKKTIGQENHGHVLLITYERARKLANLVSLKKI